MKTSTFIIFSIVLLIITLVICLYFLKPTNENFNVVSVGATDPILNSKNINNWTNNLNNSITQISTMLPGVTKSVLNDLSNNVIKQITITSKDPKDPPTTLQTLNVLVNNVSIKDHATGMRNNLDSVSLLQNMLAYVKNMNDTISNSIRNIKSINIDTNNTNNTNSLTNNLIPQTVAKTASQSVPMKK